MRACVLPFGPRVGVLFYIYKARVIFNYAKGDGAVAASDPCRDHRRAGAVRPSDPTRSWATDIHHFGWNVNRASLAILLTMCGMNRYLAYAGHQAVGVSPSWSGQEPIILFMATIGLALVSLKGGRADVGV